MGRGFHTLAWICCATIAALLATAESLALGQEAPHISVGEGPADETSFEDGFSKFDVIPPPHDHPEDAIVDFVGDEGTCVMTTHGRSGLSRVVAGSVATGVVAKSKRAVVVYRPPAAQ